MDFKRTFLYAALFVVAFNLWVAWQKDYSPKPATETPSSLKEEGNFIPHLKDEENKAKEAPVKRTALLNKKRNNDKKLIHIKTDVLEATIDTDNGDLVQAKLLKYPVSLEKKDTPFTLLSNGANKYVANSSIFTKKDERPTNVAFHFKAEKKHYLLSDSEHYLKVILVGKTANGLKATKTVTFTRGHYLVDINYVLENNTSNTWKGYLNTQLLRNAPKEDKSSIFHVGSYTGASLSNPEQKLYEKISFPTMKKQNLQQTVESGWVAMQQHYFLTAWVPKSGSKNQFYSRVIDDNYIIGTVSAPLSIQQGETLSSGAKLYVGPELVSQLKHIAPGLDLTVDYGWLWFISKYLFMLLAFIHSIVGNWGCSIVLVTLLIKLAFYRLSARSYRSMAGMRELQPKLVALKERYGDDKAKLSQATLELYRREKVNPLGGCLPILVQIPVFIGLYWVLLESVQLRQAPFIFWIKDLAAADPYYILPLVMGATMFLQQKLNPPPPDPTQAKVMMMLPVLFTFLFLHFPSGLVLYWIVNNTLSILQQWHITRRFGGKASKKKHSDAQKLALSQNE